jgi:hypothetical protein
MSKLLFERNMFQKLIDTFFKAKSKGNEDQFISKIKYTNPELSKAFKDLDDSIVSGQLKLKSVLQKRGLDTTEIDAFLDKYYDKA